MDEERSSTSVVSPSMSECDVETALSFNISQISTAAQSFDYDELIDLMGSKRTRKERRNSESTYEVIVEVAKQLEDHDITNNGSPAQDGIALSDVSPLLDALHAAQLSTRTARQYTEIRRVSNALLPDGKTSRSFSEARSVTQSQSDTSTDRETFEPCYSSPAISFSAAATPDQTVLSYESENDSSIERSSIATSASLESHSENKEEGYSVEHAGFFVSLANEKHGIEMDLCIGMSLTAPGGSLVVSTVTLP